MAVFLATSDEAVPLLVSMPAYWDKLVLLMVIKVLYAIAVGLVLDFVLRAFCPGACGAAYTGSADEIDCHEEHSDEEGKPAPIWKAALRHTLEIFVFIFVFSLVFGSLWRAWARMSLPTLWAGWASSSRWWPHWWADPQLCRQRPADPALCGGSLRFSSLVAGLCTGAGVGLAVLWRANPSWKQNLFITGLTWAAGAAVGVGIQIVVAIFG